MKDEQDPHCRQRVVSLRGVLAAPVGASLFLLFTRGLRAILIRKRCFGAGKAAQRGGMGNLLWWRENPEREKKNRLLWVWRSFGQKEAGSPKIDAHI
jgi:hypothetical protein